MVKETGYSSEALYGLRFTHGIAASVPLAQYSRGPSLEVSTGF